MPPLLRFALLLALGVLPFLFVTGSAAEEAPAVIDIGARRELFVDHFLTRRTVNIRHVLHRPAKREVAVDFTNKPWEGVWNAYVTVLNDGRRFRMYYRGAPRQGRQVTCLAYSDDGVTWTKPELGLYEFDGSKQNNIVYDAKDSTTHNFAPFLDANPKAPSDQRWKAVGGQPMFGFVSPDGLHWQRVREEPIIGKGKGAFDSQNLVFWDAERKLYHAYFRYFAKGVRDIRHATSKDFLNWTEPENLDFGETPPEHLYTNAVTPYFRAPHIFMGFPKRFRPDRKKVADAVSVGVSDGVFMTSRDGVRFHRWREAFIRPGLDPLNWVHRSNMTAWGILQTGPRELSIYVSEHYDSDTNRMRRYTLRPDGFVSLHGDPSGGEYITHPLRWKGKELTINYATSAAGGVRVELQDAEGKALPGFALDDCPEIYGDEIEHVVSWKGGSDVGELARQGVRLRFELKDADLYAIQFR